MTSLLDLITQCRQVTNTESNQFITNSELTYYLNSSLAELDDLLVVKQADYRLVQTICNITVGNTFALPADFYQLRGVDYYAYGVASNPWQTLNQFMLKERNRYANPMVRTLYGVTSIYYMLQDGYVAIVPVDAAVGQYRLWYTPIYQPLVNLTDTIPSYFDNQAWREFAVMDTAIKILNKQNLDPSAFMQRKEELKTRILAMAGHRDAGDPKCVVNNNNYFDDGFSFGMGGSGYGSF